MKKIFYGSLIILLPLLLILLSAYFFFVVVGNSEGDIEQIRLNCLNSGGTLVEYQGKIEKCIPR